MQRTFDNFAAWSASQNGATEEALNRQVTNLSPYDIAVLIPPSRCFLKAEISILVRIGHFYFGLTNPIVVSRIIPALNPLSNSE